ncbi:GH12 family glycosyl hydrolase domain-containing protein [Teredinibacter sp. KSP-S5-2]|uniref:GH12 family glycosyl hydrolase domain-containing protein n=1 Tax=Teredinibacter sp. KSP-S5-2 TaxID=3034506 RepID=UPI0029349AB9|nr:hypothetical protein [Teredinibacter sp. KSP-S5-2]WNO10045.1 hypothetical protein P5V12_02555 [Teredinibacter sp. KSP-S5-2]
MKFLFILLTSLLLSCSGDNASTNAEKKAVVVEPPWLCETELHLIAVPYWLFNNVTGIYSEQSAPEFEQCIALDTSGEETTYLWKWDLSRPIERPLYPQIIFGKKPWEEWSTSEVLPKKISELKSAITQVVYRTFASEPDKINAAYDIWITNDAQSKTEHIEAELMIWTSGEMLPPFAPISEETVDGVLYDFYYYNGWENPYIVFRRKTPAYDLSLNIQSFLTRLIEKGYITESHYLASVEFGNEVHAGFGETRVSLFSVVIE